MPTSNPNIDLNPSHDLPKPSHPNPQPQEQGQATRMRRQQLYGVGAGSHVPRVKRETDKAHGPKWAPHLKDGSINPHDAQDSLDGDGANDVATTYEHGTYHNMTYFSTTSQDPERMFMGHVGNRGPWYCGYKNSTNIVPGSILSSAARYGERGADGLKRFDMNHTVKQPIQTVNSTTPSFLSNPSFADEWTPPIHACPKVSSWP